MLGVAGLLAVHFVLASTSIRHKCSTFDEVAHLTRGYAWWQLDDKRLAPNHPPLSQAWAALPLLDDGLRFPGRSQRAWYESNVFALGKQFFYSVGNDPEAMLGQARRMTILLSVITGAVVFWWSRKLFGTAGGFVSLVLYCFSPTVLANGRLVTTEMCVALFFLLAVGGIWWVLHDVRPASVLASSAALAGLFLSKMSAVLIIPMGLAMMIVRLLSGKALPVTFGNQRCVAGKPKMVLVFVAVMVFYVLTVWVAIWAAFDFRYQAMVHAEPGRDRFFAPRPPPAGTGVWEYQGRGIPNVAAAVERARELRVLPEAYLYSFLFTMQAARGRDAFLNGDRRMTGWWYFFPLCFLYKVPLPTMGVIVAAVAAVAAGRSPPHNGSGVVKGSSGRRLLGGLYRTAPLWVLMATYWGFAVSSNLNIGHRHLMPTFAPMFIACGAAAGWLDVSRRWLRLVVPALLGLLAVCALSIWPHYLAYFNTVAGGPSNGYRHVVDSSLDWGQDLPGLKRWLDDNASGERVYLSYFGTGSQQRCGITADPLPSPLPESGTGDYRLTAGLYCISATRLQQVYLLATSEWTEEMEKGYRRRLPEMLQFEQTPNEEDTRAALIKAKGGTFKKRFKAFQELRFGRLCAYLRQREPDAHVGYSIFIYRLTDQEIDKALHGPLPKAVR
ncbi:MAG: hypothetical protein JSV19_12345 [Phycisphaerales bacterium]|nr:MAG: hypothetical protein JSV19_12345 [Phycisphaerales bacterium]